MEQYEIDYLKKHFENLIQRYRDAGVEVELEKPIDEVIEETKNERDFFIHVKIKINDRFYLRAQGDNVSKNLYGFEIRDLAKKEICKTPEQVAAFMKLFKGESK